MAVEIINRVAGAGLRTANALVTSLPGPLRPRVRDLAADCLAEVAASSGLDDFGDPEFRPHFEALLAALRDEARLNAFGALAAGRDLRNLLQVRLRLEQAIRETPAIVDEPIERPLIIVGLPRAATTYLHGLLARDPANRAPLNWEIMQPFPQPGASAGDDRAARRRCARGLWWFHRLSGDLDRKHRLAAVYPQEDVVIMSHAFQSIRFDSVYRLPGFQAAQERGDMRQAYRWHKRFLQFLQHRRTRRRWVLKAPAHLLALESLLAVYPDARLVQVNRDPVDCLPSLIGLTATMQSAFCRDHDQRALARQVCARWQRVLPGLPERRASLGLDAERILDLGYRELTRTPGAALARLYAWLGWGPPPEIEPTASAMPASRYRRRGTLDDFGLDEAALRRAFQPYADAYLDAGCL